MASPRQRLAHVIRTTPIIDNHAHPLLTLESINRYPLLAVTTEASGDAMHAAMTSLAHVRGVRQLARRLGCKPASWEAVVNAIEERRLSDADYAAWAETCLAGIETVLVDDGLDSDDDVFPYGYFDRLTPGKAKRIVRIEKLAQQIIEGTCFVESDDEDSDGDVDPESADVPPPTAQRTRRWSGPEGDDETKLAFTAVFDAFDARIRKCLDDPEVVGFKSIICYRTGLDIPAKPDPRAGFAAFARVLAERRAALAVGNPPPVGSFRLQHEGLNELFVHRTAELIASHGTRATDKDGDADGRDVAQRAPRKPLQFHTGLGDSDITLSRASPAHLQPFIRTYPDVPVVLLHASYPFTREAGYLATVYPNVYADIGEVFPFVSQDGQERLLREVLELCPWSKILWSTDGHWFPETYYLATEQVREVLEKVLVDYCQQGHITWMQAEHLVRDVLFHNSNKLYHLALDFRELTPEIQPTPRPDLSNHDLLVDFLQNTGDASFLRINWLDYTATPRVRVLPMRRALAALLADDSFSIGITKAVFGLLQNDAIVPGVSPVGEYRLYPDLSSLRRGPRDGHVSCWGEFREQDGTISPLCPRGILSRVVGDAARAGLNFDIGFEIELLVLGRGVDPATSKQIYVPLHDDGHAWSVGRTLDGGEDAAGDLVERAVEALARADIHVEQFHAESAPGQFEIILPKAPPLEAVETLLHARAIITSVAAAAGRRVTLHPKPFADTAGTASHMHVSIRGRGDEDARVYKPFWAGVLRRLRAIVAITYASPASYERVVDGAWAGGRWVCWGTQNREAALRKIEFSHWEVKTLDGTANPYFAVAAVLAAGVAGVSAHEELVWGDCEVDPAALSANDRHELGVKEMLPASLDQALVALKGDEVLGAALGEEFVERYGAVKEAEIKVWEGMREHERRQWVMGRY